MEQAQDKAQATHDPAELVNLTSTIVSAYVGNNPVPATELPKLIKSVHETISEVSGGASSVDEEELVPAVSPKKSVSADYIICLEDGKKFKSLKRHLRSKYNLTPEQYRERWGLPYDYPMVAPNYAKRRSELARQMGLGQARAAAAKK